MNPFQSAALRIVVLDFDGTILDSLDAITSSVNDVRARHRVRPRTRDEVCAAIGAGARVLAERTLGDLVTAEGGLDPLFAEFRAIYLRRSAAGPKLYPGAAEFLSRARSRWLLALLTNKPRDITHAILGTLGLTAAFARVVCPEDARAVKPDPASLLDLLATLSMGPEEAIFIGDSVHDFAAGRGAGVFTLGLRGGYYTPGTPDPDLWVDDFGVLLAFLDSTR